MRTNNELQEEITDNHRKFQYEKNALQEAYDHLT